MHRSYGLRRLWHKRPTFAFVGKSEYTLAFANRIAHSGLHAETGGVSNGGAISTLGAFRTCTNIPGPGIRTASFAAFGAWSEALLKDAESLRNRDAHDARRCSAGVAAPLGCVIFSVSVEIAACTHSALREKSHTRAYTAKHGAFWVGALSLPSERSVRFGNPAWPGLKTANFAAFGSWSGGALEERREPAEQRCAYARRCSKASRPRWAA